MKDRTVVWNGKQIKEPGVYEGVPLDVYHSQEILDGPSVSSTNLRRVLEVNGGSPAHFYCEWTGNPKRVEPNETKAMIIGRATHHLLLGQPRFAESYVLCPPKVRDKHDVIVEWNPYTNAAKEFKARAAQGGRRWNEETLRWDDAPGQKPLTVIRQEDVADILGMRDALLRHPLIRPPNLEHGLLNGYIERSFFWKDKRTGLWLKARPDAVPTDSGDYADLKTTTSVQYNKLQFAITDCAYHQQAALVREGSLASAGIAMSSFTFVFVEKCPPYCVRLVALSAEDIEIGARQNRVALDIIADCIKAKSWPGPGRDHIVHVHLTDRYRENANLEDATAGKAA